MAKSLWDSLHPKEDTPKKSLLPETRPDPLRVLLPKDGAPVAVEEAGGGAVYDLIDRLDNAVDFTDWEDKTTVQQRRTLQKTDLDETEQWLLLNKDGDYLETISTIRDIKENRRDYNLTVAASERVFGELIAIAKARVDATSKDSPYGTPAARRTFLAMLDEKQQKLLAGIGYDKNGSLGGAGGGWYNGPKVTPGPQTTPLPQPGPGPEDLSPKELAALSAEIKKTVRTLENTALSKTERASLNLAKTLLGAGYLAENVAQVLALLTKITGKTDWLNNVKQNANPAATWDDRLITNQKNYPGTAGSFGPLGNINANGCGGIALHNVSRLLGEKSNFSDVVYALNANGAETMNVGGRYGMNPLVVREYFGSSGHGVRLYADPASVPTTHDAYLALYFYEGKKGLGAHYVALQYDPVKKEFHSFNDPDAAGNPQSFQDFADMKKCDSAFAMYVWGIDK